MLVHNTVRLPFIPILEKSASCAIVFDSGMHIHRDQWLRKWSIQCHFLKPMKSINSTMKKEVDEVWLLYVSIDSIMKTASEHSVATISWTGGVIVVVGIEGLGEEWGRA